MSSPRITVLYEDTPQPHQAAYERQYPRGIGAAISGPLRAKGLEVHEARFTEPQNGLPDAVLETTDVLIHWGHRSMDLLTDETVSRIRRRVLFDGMGLILLHSAVTGGVFRSLIGSSASFIYRNVGERERVWVIDGDHPITAGLPPYFELEEEEMYGERFDIPPPDDLVFISWFEGGEVIRSGCVWRRGRGRVFFFRPGHETAPTFHHDTVRQMLINAVHWLAPQPAALGPAHVPAKDPPEGRYNNRIADAAAQWAPLPVVKRP